MVNNLSDLTHASRGDRFTFCGKAADKGDKVKMIYFHGFTRKFWSMPTCKTCREKIRLDEYSENCANPIHKR